MSSIITHAELIEATGCKTKSSLEKLLREQKVRFLYGANGTLWTTDTALNAALGLQSIEQPNEPIEFLR